MHLIGSSSDDERVFMILLNVSIKYTMGITLGLDKYNWFLCRYRSKGLD